MKSQSGGEARVPEGHVVRRRLVEDIGVREHGARGEAR